MIKKKYEKPSIKVIEFVCELGYAASCASSVDNNANKIDFLWYHNNDDNASINTGATFSDDIWLN